MNDIERVLVSILAATDAVHWPVRRFRNLWCVNAGEARIVFAERGVPFRHGASNDAERKRLTRGLDAAVETGDVTIVRVPGEKIPFVRLTEIGELKAQHLAANSSIIDGWCWALFEAVLRRPGTTPEDDLLPAWRKALDPVGEWTREASLQHVCQSLLPFLRRGWIDAGSSTHGNVRYWPGPNVAEAKRPSFEVPDVDINIGRNHYDDAFEAALESLRTTEPTNTQSIGIMPIPASAVSAAEVAAWKRSTELAANGE